MIFATRWNCAPIPPWECRASSMATANGYKVLAGGLARIASDSAEIVSMQRGGGSKDVWVLAQDRKSVEEPQSLEAVPRAPSRHDDLPSRLAENLFWLGRY